jgi:hypothetical protein
MEHGAVRRRSPPEMVPFDQPCKSAALAGAQDIHLICRLENLRDQDLFSHVWYFCAVFETELPQDAARRDSGFFEMAGFRLVHPGRTNEFHKTQLDRLVAVRLLRLLLNDDTRAGFDHGDRNNGSVLIKNLSHPYLYSNQSINHNDRFPFPVPRSR